MLTNSNPHSTGTVLKVDKADIYYGNYRAVRELSKLLGLPWWNEPAQPCLSSRFPYGERITIEKLQRVGRAEQYLRSLGWTEVRVRSADDTARIEIPSDRLLEFVQTTPLPTLVSTFQSYGFLFVTLDLEGFQSGKLNRSLTAV